MRATASPRRALVLGALWGVGLRWAVRALGFVNTVVMARLLMPADYGIVAMAMLVVGLIQALLDFGARTALLRKAELTRDEIDSAWTLNLIESLLVAALLAAGASLAAAYFDEPRVRGVLYVLAVCVCFAGLGNIGFTLAQREFRFALEFKHQVICKTLGVLATIGTGYWLRDYRALVIGVATGYVSGMVFSYTMHPYRPRWNTSKIGEIWAVTKWLMVSGAGWFILRKGDELVAGHIGTTRQFGLYNVASDLGQMPAGEVGPAMLRALLPVLSSIQGDLARTNAAVVKTVATVSAVTLPVGFGFAAVAVPATQLLLGSTWADAAPLVAVFALVGALQSLSSPILSLLVLRGQTRAHSFVVWAEFIAFVTFSLMLVPSFHLMGLAMARVLASLANAVLAALAGQRRCGLAPWPVLGAVARPLVGACLMATAVHGVLPLVTGMVPQLVLGVATGAAVYAGWAVLSWYVAGKPEGLESLMVDQLATWRANRKAKHP